MNFDSTTYPLTIYYDASCSLCSAEIENLRVRDRAQRLVFVDASAANFESPLSGATREDLMNIIHARCADGRVVRGVEVFRLAYISVGLGWVATITRLPGVRQCADWAYPVLVRNRYRIPKVLVRLLFEGPAKRAAQRAAAQRCEGGAACAVDASAETNHRPM